MRHLSVRTIDQILSRAMNQAGIEGNYSPHSIRATFITTALKNGASESEVQRAAGHVSVQTTLRYDRRAFGHDQSASFKASY